MVGPRFPGKRDELFAGRLYGLGLGLGVFPDLAGPMGPASSIRSGEWVM